ncbi:DnaJ domain-containing protein [Variovorax arabinosiphilus]|uniref:DnaJ domain-containing protein n=1 Tax=Variovorax arabinosiphilus TaxID=3053498 RepID=UPI00257883DF|nr:MULTISPECIES: DnaJ domain-containing protein [unclassified Variovorax]MDM0119607.1 DnaJ domain-containing protein [Variovorax sp. J2L1-78]MDM0128481.1 DnaJ domain-containing protein [Variovorax sp. J2L1-63]MDM0232181.1 DnaJ domain-containing protein [Variovorax sp. J2R1-6]
MSLYALLGVPEDASLEEIEAGYRRAREALGPERTGIALRWRWRLRRLQRARACLGDPARRQAYDAMPPLIELFGTSPPGLL